MTTIIRRSVAVFIAIAMSQVVEATIVYELQDYPDLQNGHSLSGTITTTSDAPDDGLLTAGEILDWQFDVTGPQPFSAMKTSDSPTEVFGAVGITPTQISIDLPPFGEESELSLTTSASGTSGYLRYLAVNDLIAGVEQYEAGVREESLGPGGVTQVQFNESWQTFPVFPLVIAASPIVPEPSFVSSWAVLGIVLLFRVRQKVTRSREVL